jgi:hypothetical protein
MNTNNAAEGKNVDSATQRRIRKCGSCGQKVLKRDSETLEEIGLCQQCARRELEPLANSLIDAFCLCGAPETIEIAKNRGRDCYYDSQLKLALELYKAGWRLTRAVESPESSGETE